MTTVTLVQNTAAADAPASAGRAGVFPSLGLGLVVVLLQVALACLLSGQSDLRQAYFRLFWWDSGWYASIVDRGYVSPPPLTRDDPGNVAFFPAYPLGAWLVKRASGWPTPLALLLTAQLSAWGFWTYLFLFFRRWGASPALTALGAALIASHPAAFYLVAAYTESLFLFSLLGFLYWSGEGSGRGLCLAALHGFVMTSTRFVGLPVVVYPMIHLWFNAGPATAGRADCQSALRGATPARGWVRRLLPALVTSAFAGLGTVFFLLYCHVRFGRWDLYITTSVVGWGTSANYLAFFSWRTYLPHPPFLRDGFLNPIWFNQFLVPFTLVLFAALIMLEYRRGRWHAQHGRATGWRLRAGFYACAALMYYVSVCGNSRVSMFSMVRFLLCVEVLLVLAVAHWLALAGPLSERPAWLRTLAGAWVVLGFVLVHIPLYPRPVGGLMRRLRLSASPQAARSVTIPEELFHLLVRPLHRVVAAPQEIPAVEAVDVGARAFDLKERRQHAPRRVGTDTLFATTRINLFHVAQPVLLVGIRDGR